MGGEHELDGSRSVPTGDPVTWGPRRAGVLPDRVTRHVLFALCAVLVRREGICHVGLRNRRLVGLENSHDLWGQVSPTWLWRSSGGGSPVQA